MSTAPVVSYAFGPFQLDARARQLFREGKPIALAPKTAELLVLLVRDHGRLVTKETVMETVWPGLFVEDTNLAQHISRLRKTLGSASYIDTIPRRGYRFVADVIENARLVVRPRVPRASTTVPRRHTVGRARQLGELHAAFDIVAGGTGLMLVVTGEAGKGKTTVVEEFLSTLDACWIARGRCSERLAGSEAYLPLMEAMENLRKNDSFVEDVMKSSAPSWFDPQRIHAGTADQLKRELSAFFRDLTVAQPLVLFIEDVHWAGVSTVELLAWLGTSLTSLRMMIIVTARMEELRQARHPFLTVQQELQARRACRELPVPFLTEPDLAEYLALEFRDHVLPGEFISLLHARTEGNPLFMVDLVQSLRARGLITQKNGVWHLSETSPDVTDELPESVRAMTERKIGQLSDADRQLLVAASVQGEEFDVAVVADAMSTSLAATEERFHVLEREFALVQRMREHELPDGTVTLRYRFVHVLYQNALYGSLAPTRRADLSRGVGTALLRFFGERSSMIASELALLFEAARDHMGALGFYARAAEKALSVFAYHEVEYLARRGIAIARILPNTPERADHELDLLSALSVTLMATKGFSSDEVRDVCLRIRELGAERGETRHVIPAIYGLCSFYEVRAEYAPCLHWGREFLRLAEQRHDPSLLLQGHTCLGDALLWMGRFDEALHHTEQAIAIDERLTEPRSASLSGFDAAIASRILRALALGYLGQSDRAVAASEQAVAMARKLSQPPTLVFALFFSAVLHQHLREPNECLVRTDEAMALCREHGLADWIAWASFWHGWATVLTGAADDGIAAMLESLSRQDTLGSHVNRSMMLAMLADAYRYCGRTDEALAAVDEGLRFVARTDERCYEHELQRLKNDLVSSIAGR